MNSYLLFKSLHLIAVISWMAGLLYLPRIFVYHADASDKFELKETFKLMEKRLYFYIMNPAMILSWIFGVLLIHSVGSEIIQQKWMAIKLILVIILTIYHVFLLKCLRGFQLENNEFSSKFYRIINEVPTLLLIIIIFVVIFKPL
ncbi:MAG: TIGR00701 family protein [Pelagibacteraceae bacterium TMED216]|nr:MAG: TIGR00701 family protein [Pelagibacteraceae bacterium TMED216]